MAKSEAVISHTKKFAALGPIWGRGMAQKRILGSTHIGKQLLFSNIFLYSVSFILVGVSGWMAGLNEIIIQATAEAVVCVRAAFGNSKRLTL